MDSKILRSQVNKFLKKEFQQRRLRNPKYSVRAFARFLGLSPASVCHYLQGQQMPSQVSAQKIIAKLKSQDPSFPDQIFQEGLEHESRAELLDFEKIACLSSWYYFAILSLMECDDFDDDAKWIAKRLNIQVDQVNEALQTLERLQMIKRVDGVLCSTGLSYSTPSQVANWSLKKTHAQALELAHHALQKCEAHDYNISGAVVALDPRFLHRAFEKIAKFQRRLAHSLEEGQKKEVYWMSVQLFPVSAPVDSKGKLHEDS